MTDTANIGPCFYFGCHREPGHYLWTETERHAGYAAERSFPFRYTILDGGLLPVGVQEIEGAASLIYIGGWTVITFWDRSVDKRGGCNSAFVIPSKLSFDDAIALSKVRFKWVWKRFKFDVKLSAN